MEVLLYISVIILCLCWSAWINWSASSVLPSFCFVLVEEDTEGSSRSGRDSMSTSGDLIAGPGVNGHLSKDDRQKDRDKTVGREKKKPEREKDKERDKDRNKAKKGVLRGLGDMFRYVATPLPRCLQHQRAACFYLIPFGSFTRFLHIHRI